MNCQRLPITSRSPLRHRLHDVGVAVGDVAAERDAEDEAHHHQPADVRHERLRQREDDEHDHGGRGTSRAARSCRRASRRAARRSSRRPACPPPPAPAAAASGWKMLVDEDQHEGDRVEVPRLDQDRGHHQPADAVAFRIVFANEVAGRRRPSPPDALLPTRHHLPSWKSAARNAAAAAANPSGSSACSQCPAFASVANRAAGNSTRIAARCSGRT